ncbi:MAG: hypothetical protein RIT04_490 [Candidatus Parcubacteria bacterium]|jgi:broad specificity phosphatase PhoE
MYEEHINTLKKGSNLKFKVIAVFHGKKVEGLKGQSPEIAANPPMTVPGMEGILKLVPAIKAFGPFDESTGIVIWTSIIARAMCTASVLATSLGINEIQCHSLLGQFANLDEGVVIPYPGHEQDDEVTWQKSGACALREIASRCYESSEENKKLIVVSHRPIIAGLIALSRGITDKAGIAEILNDPNLAKNGFVIFDLEWSDVEGVGEDWSIKLAE